MKHYGLSDIHWVDEKLYLSGKNTKLKIVADGEFFRVKWPDGVVSADYYNFTRARHVAKLYVLEHIEEFLLNQGERAAA